MRLLFGDDGGVLTIDHMAMVLFGGVMRIMFVSMRMASGSLNG